MNQLCNGSIPRQRDGFTVQLEPRLAAFARPADGRKVRTMELQVEPGAPRRKLPFEFVCHSQVIILGEDASRDA